MKNIELIWKKLTVCKRETNRSLFADYGGFMAVIDVNTNYINDAGNDIISLTNEIRAILDDTFSMIENMTSETGEWQGKAAQEFVASANVDRANYNKFNQEVNNFGKYLIDYSNSMESLISKVNRG